jgi:lipoprotein-anchoring transpeptidase ErfK/SrfK
VGNGRWLVAGAAGLVLAGAVGYVATGPATAAGHRVAQRPAGRPVPPAAVTVAPADGAAGVAPDARVQITASGGTLTQVTVASGGSAVAGQYGPGAVTWSTRRGLEPGSSYTVTVVARNGKGAAMTRVTHFRTSSAARILQISGITPDAGETVGVGMPIIVDFNYDVARPDRAAVEQALQVGSDVPVTGAWFWASGSEVVFRPQGYWPAHEHVRLTADLTGVPGGPGLWGGSDLSHWFTIGDAHLVTVNLRTDWAYFYINGSLARTIPVSGGTGGYDSFGNDFYTTSGVHLTMGSYDSVWMTSPNIQPGQPGYYHELVYDDVQISDSGEYMHQSPGGWWCLGHENCSHGCVRMTADGAAWWRHTAYRGDPVTITGTPRVLAWDNGWGYWQQSWSAWLAGSSAGALTTTALEPASPAAAGPAPAAPIGNRSLTTRLGHRLTRPPRAARRARGQSRPASDAT